MNRLSNVRKPKLLDRVRAEIRMRHYSFRTEEAYVGWMKNVDRESFALSTSPEFIAIIQAARAEFQSGKKLSLEEMKQEVLE